MHGGACILKKPTCAQVAVSSVKNPVRTRVLLELVPTEGAEVTGALRTDGGRLQPPWWQTGDGFSNQLWWVAVPTGLRKEAVEGAVAVPLVCGLL